MTSRLDSELVARGLARSRSHAAALIRAGAVMIDRTVARKTAQSVSDETNLVVTETDPYVSRAAHKLIAALDTFEITPNGHCALDLGASTGGFTQVLRERGARPVLAVDVGHGQLAASVADDPDVIVAEGFHAKYMTPRTLHEATGIADQPQIITADLSFISLTQIIPAITAVCAETCDIVLLIKPQFEVGRAAIGRGVVTDSHAHAEAVMAVLRCGAENGLGTDGLMLSPVRGTRGNTEYLAYMTPQSQGLPTQWEDKVTELTGQT